MGTERIVKKLLLRIKRYTWFLAQYYLYEKPRGLDFTMRQTDLYEKSEGRYNGYSKTNEKHLREIFEKIPDKDNMSFLDIGCGKGVVLKEAAKYPFQKVDGIEIQQELVMTAKKNFEILGISDRVRCIHSDAVQFSRYGDYDVFFLFNPFSEDILQRVADKIIESRSERNHRTVIIYHNPVFLHVFERNARILKKELLHDKLKNYDTCILELM